MARETLFERLIGLRNHLGLCAEQYEPKLRRQIGNFPRAFTHLALIVTAHGIDAVRAGGERCLPRRGEVAGAEA